MQAHTHEEENSVHKGLALKSSQLLFTTVFLRNGLNKTHTKHFIKHLTYNFC